MRSWKMLCPGPVDIQVLKLTVLRCWFRCCSVRSLLGFVDRSAFFFFFHGLSCLLSYCYVFWFLCASVIRALHREEVDWLQSSVTKYLFL